MQTMSFKCTECGKAFTMAFYREPSYADLRKTTCPGCGAKQAFILPANRSHLKSPLDREKQSEAVKAKWAVRRAIFARAKAAGFDVDPVTDVGAKSETTALLSKGLLSAINYRRYEQNLPRIRPFEFNPWEDHKDLVTPALLQSVFGGSVHDAALCWRLFRVKISPSRRDEV